jgi:hypothetical protein
MKISNDTLLTISWIFAIITVWPLLVAAILDGMEWLYEMYFV